MQCPYRLPLSDIYLADEKPLELCRGLLYASVLDWRLSRVEPSLLGADSLLDVVFPHPPVYRNLGPLLHGYVILVANIPGKTAELPQDSIEVLEVDGLGPLMVHHVRDRQTLSDQLQPLRF